MVAHINKTDYSLNISRSSGILRLCGGAKPAMTSYDAELERLNSPKQKLLSRFPKQAVYARYLKSLFRGEIELRLLAWLCDRALVSVDAGAHHGIYTLGSSLYSKRVIAVEPQHDRAESLRRSLPSNAALVEGALSSKVGTAALKIPLNDWDSISRLDFEDTQDKQWRYERVSLLRMDDIVQERVGFVKIDVEGHEREVLDGAARVISSDRPAFLIEIEERHRVGSVDDVTRFLQDRGYLGYFVQGNTIRAIREFDVQTHQDPSLIGRGDRVGYRDYINNFIFVRSQMIPPLTVPSSWQALRSSLRQFANGGR
jgi:FkbM family methyltransferase